MNRTEILDMLTENEQIRRELKTVLAYHEKRARHLRALFLLDSHETIRQKGGIRALRNIG